MNRVFVDTVGFLALWDEDDQWHAAAEAAWLNIAPGTILFTSSYVLLECGNAAARTSFRADVNDARVLYEKAGTLIHPVPEDWESAWATYLSHGAAGAGIVDHVSFAIMTRMGITDAFSNARHFKAAGFNALF